MIRVRWSPRARQDLLEIIADTRDRWGEEQAVRYAHQLESSIKAIAKRPGLGRPCDELRVGVSCHPSGSHLIFFRRAAQKIDIIRVLHERMLPRRHLPP